MAEQDFQERTEKATGRRRQKAREEGQVARSMELNSAMILCLGFLSLYLLGPYLADQSLSIMRNTMAHAPEIATSDPSFIKIFSDSTFRFFLLAMPIMALLVVVAFGVNVAQVGFKITPKALEPKWEKLNPVNGFKRLVSVRSAMQLLRDSLKLLVVGFVAYKAIKSEFAGFFLMPDMTIGQFASSLGGLALGLVLKIGAMILVIAILDFIYQRYEFEKSIRMSKQELKEEYKETEGSPQVRSRIRQIQRDVARKRMMAAVLTADVVVTNPTHLAIALKYNTEEMDAPYVVAKGERLIAEKIKQLAREHGVPVIEDKPLARALFKICDVGQMIPANLFRAVAELLAYVYKTKGKVLN